MDDETDFDARHDTAPEPKDRLPEWLHTRYGPLMVPLGEFTLWHNLHPDDVAYWQHEAAAVRRAVARGGFKSGNYRPDPDGPRADPIEDFR